MSKPDPRKIVLATYREPKPKAKRCGTCIYCESGNNNLCWCDAWTKRD